MPGRLFSKYFVHKVTDEGSLCQFASKPGRLFSQGGLITDEGTDERADYIESIMPLASLYWRRHKHLGPLPRPHRIKPLNACANCLPRLRHISIIGLKFDFTELVASKLADILQIFKQRFVGFFLFLLRYAENATFQTLTNPLKTFLVSIQFSSRMRKMS